MEIKSLGSIRGTVLILSSLSHLLIAIFNYIDVWGGDPNFNPNKKKDRVQVFCGQSKQNPPNCH
jgi:hypothetical protein